VQPPPSPVDLASVEVVPELEGDLDQNAKLSTKIIVSLLPTNNFTF
jgi:hypothetical protein